MKSVESEIISRLRWPLMVLVVMLHSSVYQAVDCHRGVIQVPEVYHAFGFVSYFMCSVFGRVAVPLFYLISGYVFFRWTDGFTWDTYKGKISRRIRTLAVPYLLWNALYIAAFFALSFVTSDSAFDIYRHFDWLAILKQLWVDPPCFPFWFIRDLMVMCLLTIVTEPLLRHLRWIAPVLLLVIWLGRLWPSFPGTGFLDSHCIFFLLGACAGIRHLDLPETLRRPSGWLVITLIFVYVFLGLLETSWRDTEMSNYMHNFNILVGIVAAVTLTAYCVRRDVPAIPTWIASSGFFLFGYHGIAVKMIRNSLLPIIKPASDLAFIGIFAIDFLVTVTVGVLLYNAAVKLIPKTTALFCGRK